MEAAQSAFKMKESAAAIHHSPLTIHLFFVDLLNKCGAYTLQERVPPYAQGVRRAAALL
ncbi:MAG: hypothetical protein QOE46_1998 [Acidobacteriota bacterium]|jgi:hypothetical protein|nr:hypothetical protein [Acidobacteriota bacterium]